MTLSGTGLNKKRFGSSSGKQKLISNVGCVSTDLMWWLAKAKAKDEDLAS